LGAQMTRDLFALVQLLLDCVFGNYHKIELLTFTR